MLYDKDKLTNNPWQRFAKGRVQRGILSSLTFLHGKSSLAWIMAGVIVGEAGVYATVLTLGARYGQWAAGTMLYDLHILIGCKLLFILQSQSKSEVLKGIAAIRSYQ